MNKFLLLSTLAAALAVSGPLAQASTSFDAAGQIPVSNINDYVQAGSYRIWVTTHLGRPTHVLPDGVWLYENRRIDNLDATGTLAITFKDGQVISMRLLTHAATVALLQAHASKTRVAAR